MRASAVRTISFGWRRSTSSAGARSTRFSATQLGEGRRLEDAEADPQAHGDQEDAQEEGDAPAPGQELVARERAEGEHGEVGEEQAGRDAELGPGGDEAAVPVLARPLHREQDRAAPLPADADALDEAQHREE